MFSHTHTPSLLWADWIRLDSFPDFGQVAGHVIRFSAMSLVPNHMRHGVEAFSIRDFCIWHIVCCLLANSKLITKPVTPLFKSASTNTPFCVSILSNPIFTVIFLKGSSLFGVPACIIQLASIANLLQEPSQGLPGSLSLLNHLHCSNCSYI